MHKIALVGKPNVGKSTLFNRLIGKKRAIVHDEPGITRDRIYGICNWLNKDIQVIDTGGIVNDKKQTLQTTINQQVAYAIDESDTIVFVTSLKDGVDKNDMYIAKLLKKVKSKNIVIVVNKFDGSQVQINENVFYSLGYGKPNFISAEHGIGVGDFLDNVVNTIKTNQTAKEDNSLKFCIIGKPNVGKSSLVNCILSKEQVIVSDIAGTTRDSIDCPFKYKKKDYTIIDTAGIRRKGKIKEMVEKVSVLQAQSAISRSNIILLVLDGSLPFNEQDEVIGGLCFEANIPSIIVVNKWDAVIKNEKTMNEYIKLIRNQFRYLSWAPIIFVSAKENLRIETLFNTFDLINSQLNIKVSTSLLNDVVAKAEILNPPSRLNGGRISITYATQVESQIPTFVLFCNNPKFLHFSFSRYIENQIREAFGIDSVPITVYYKDKNARNRIGVK